MVTWENRKLDSLMNIETGSRNTEDKIDGGHYPFFVRSQDVERIDDYAYDCEAVLTAGDGVGTGKVFHYVNCKFNAHQRVYVMSQFNGIDGKYFYYYFSSNFLDEVAKYTAKSSVDSVRRAMIADMEIPLPPLPEQRCIAVALSDADVYIAALEKLIVKKRAIKQGAMQEMLTGKRRLTGFSGAWVSCGLPEVLVKGNGIKIGPFGSQLKKEYLVQNGAFRVYGQENVYQNDFSFGSRYLTRERFENLQSCEIKPGDFVISTMGTIGKCATVPPDICVGIMDSHLIRLRIDKSKLLPQYLLHLFSSDFHYLENQTSRLSVGGIMDGLSTKIVCALEIEYPESADEQTAIAEILSNMDAEIDALTAKLNKLRHIKQGMMSELLSGRIRLVGQETAPQVVAAKKVVELPKQETKGHNQQFDDAVMIAGIVNALYSDKYPLGRKKLQKCLYLLRRHQDESTAAFKKKAAGPYADEVRYKGGEPIAQSARYITTTNVKGKGTTFARGGYISQALGYIESWGKQGDIKWVTDKLKYKKVDDLELLATVDMAICDLEEVGTAVSVASIKHLIATNEEWKAKLKKQTFSDTNIARAIRELQTLLQGGN